MTKSGAKPRFLVAATDFFIIFMVSIRIELAFQKNRFCSMNTWSGRYLESENHDEDPGPETGLDWTVAKWPGIKFWENPKKARFF